jgi:biotin synthase
MIDRSEIERWLREADEQRLGELWQRADAVRREYVGDAVHLRALVEVSNYCGRDCGYCGLRAANTSIERYRMTHDEILECARLAVELGCGTIVLQSGEDLGLGAKWVAELIRRIRSEIQLAVTLSLGERSEQELEQWRESGADRYLLRFETSNRTLFERIHPPRLGRVTDRIAILRTLRALGYETGSGVMIGIPGQSWSDLADDLELFRNLDLDMIGVGPFIPHPQTPLGRGLGPQPLAPAEQVPNDELTACKVVALTRLVCPLANIPSTTALETLNPEGGREAGLVRGANIIMPNLTPGPYRQRYEIYPGKACGCLDPVQTVADLRRRIAALGRSVGSGRGDSANYRRRVAGR